MAIITSLEDKEWNLIQNILEQTLRNRKYPFQSTEIFKIIQEQCNEKGMDSSILNCAYFRVLFLNTLDQFVEEGLLYPLNNHFYLPVSYMAFQDYHTKFLELLYLEDSKGKVPYVRVDTLQETDYRNPRDFLLTGGFQDETKLDWKSPDISLTEIASLYQDFIKEGASKEEAINYVLNCYQIQFLPPKDGDIHTVVISPKEKRKTLKKDNSI